MMRLVAFCNTFISPKVEITKSYGARPGRKPFIGFSSHSFLAASSMYGFSSSGLNSKVNSSWDFGKTFLSNFISRNSR